MNIELPASEHQKIVTTITNNNKHPRMLEVHCEQGTINFRIVGSVAHIDSIFVNEEFRRMGYGKAMLLRLVDFCKQNNIATIDAGCVNQNGLSLVCSNFEDISFYIDEKGNHGVMCRLSDQ